MNNEKISLDEQETIIYFDYKKKEVHVYTTRNSVYNKLKRNFGDPKPSKVLGGDWYFSFNDRKKLRSVMGMNLYLPRKNK